ncbi:hypothetical protein AZF37_09735 (plasmid) [endosymbiont 'TC1' of Trimyema compressum]|uniref:hypothetical protein n=1 Tax=endosymbiont 'TC1' of Trimyema compressum TaxID=243899 RepID=UPI0007F0E1F3|nr:hypothetical protein [endosymbiont 'TC1' of Trimyema compressum]AMP21454.1 hypothetical protein AZF37_09735 [endosymbiont 'TC1' of Trimyema compressum]
MKINFNVYGYNNSYGKFKIHTSDLYNLTNNITEAVIDITSNKIGSFLFKIYPNNEAFKKLLPLETDIVVEEENEKGHEQIFTGILLNRKSFADENLNIGMEITCISSHIFFKYRPVCVINNVIKDKNIREYKYTSKNFIDSILMSLQGCQEEFDVNRYSFDKQKTDQVIKQFSASYNEEESLNRLILDSIHFYELNLNFIYDFNTHMHIFYFNKQDDATIASFKYGDLVYNYSDEFDYSSFANCIYLSGKEVQNTTVTAVAKTTDPISIKKYGSFRVNRTCDIDNLAVIESEVKRQLTLAKEPQTSFNIEFIDQKNIVKLNRKIKIINEALGTTAEFFIKKINFDLSAPYVKKIELKNIKFNYIKTLAKIYRGK